MLSKDPNLPLRAKLAPFRRLCRKMGAVSQPVQLPQVSAPRLTLPRPFASNPSASNASLRHVPTLKSSSFSRRNYSWVDLRPRMTRSCGRTILRVLELCMAPYEPTYNEGAGCANPRVHHWSLVCGSPAWKKSVHASSICHCEHVVHDVPTGQARVINEAFLEDNDISGTEEQVPGG